MVSARDAVVAIGAHLSGDADALSIYEETLSQAFFQYAQFRKSLYAQLNQENVPII
jgi:hypothetical protein